MNRALGHFCAHTGLIGPGEPTEDGEMGAMTLPSGHRIRNSNPEAEHATSRSRRLPTYEVLRVDGEETFLSRP